MNDESFWGSGWSFPPTFELANAQLNLVKSQSKINQSIRIILETRQGERSLNPFFGSSLKAHLFKTPDSTLKGEIENCIKSSLLDFEPRIDVKSVEVRYVEPNEPIAEISISYVIRKTNTRHNYVYPFHLNEASNLIG